MCSAFMRFNSETWQQSAKETTYKIHTQTSAKEWATFSDAEKRSWVYKCLGGQIDCTLCDHCPSRRHTSPFMKFSNVHRHLYTGNMIERAKKLGVAWNNLSKDEKKKYA